MSDTHFDPPSFDGPGLDSAVENAWREFEARLARRLATLGDCQMVFITPSAEIANDRRFAIRAGRPGGVRVTVACPVDEPRRLVELGWRSTADGRLIREEPPSRADVIAGLVERTLREHWSMPAPAFLADTGRPHPDGCPIVAAEEMGPDAVRDLVKHDIETWFGGHLPLRADGTLQLPTGPVEASIGVSHEEPRIDVFARVATDMHPRFADTVVADVATRHPGVQLVLDGADLFAVRSISAVAYHRARLFIGLHDWFTFVDTALPTALRPLRDRRTAARRIPSRGARLVNRVPSLRPPASAH